MRRILLTLSYDGTAYSGWQVQKNAPTVQQTLQNAAEKVFGTRPGITGCSRTDSGVHANMFCCHFDTNSNISENRIPFALNMLLPNDISVYNAKEVTPDFHARYDAKSKEYIYKMYISPHKDPFLDAYALKISNVVNIDIMEKSADKIIGTYDFSSFCAKGSTVQDMVRTVNNCEIIKENQNLILKIKGDGFLYNMVRIIMGTLLDFGLKNTDPQKIQQIISVCDRTMAGPTAPAKALFLNEVIY